MNRRNFLKFLGVAGAATVATTAVAMPKPEAAKPAEKFGGLTVRRPVTYKQSGNTMLTPTQVTKEALRIMHEQLEFARTIKPR